MSDQVNAASPGILDFLKSPWKDIPVISTNREKVSVFVQLIIIEILLAVLCGSIIAILTTGLNLMKENKIQSFFDDGPVWMVIILGVVVGPVIEELFFRLHLRLNEKYIQFNVIMMVTGFVFIMGSVIDIRIIQISLVVFEIVLLVIYFARKDLLDNYILNLWNRKYFYIFYITAATFGILHITNYSPGLISYLLMPILVLPQFILGLFCGYVRLKLGFRWSCIFHAVHNFIFIIPFLITSLSNGLNNKSVNPGEHENMQPADTETNHIEIVDSMGFSKLTRNFEEQFEFRFNYYACEVKGYSVVSTEE